MDKQQILTVLISSKASCIWDSFSVGLNDVLLKNPTMPTLTMTILYIKPNNINVNYTLGEVKFS